MRNLISIWRSARRNGGYESADRYQTSTNRVHISINMQGKLCLYEQQSSSTDNPNDSSHYASTGSSSLVACSSNIRVVWTQSVVLRSTSPTRYGRLVIVGSAACWDVGRS